MLIKFKLKLNVMLKLTKDLLFSKINQLQNVFIKKKPNTYNYICVIVNTVSTQAEVSFGISFPTLSRVELSSPPP